jgi:hypothetical protein
VRIDAKQLSGKVWRKNKKENRCPHHKQCRADLARPEEMLCGYHSHERWFWCSLYERYEQKAKKAKGEQGA